MTDRRAKFRVDLSPLFLPFYDALCARLGPDWQPYSGFRSFQAQDLLFEQRPKVTNARGGESAHNWGCATDWALVVGSELTWPKPDSPAWKPFLDAVEACGLRSGIEFHDIDHVELKIAHSWKDDILRVFRTDGEEAAIALIKASILGKLPDCAA